MSAAEDQGTPLDPAAPTGALQAPQAVAIAAPVTFRIQTVVLLNEEQNRLFTGTPLFLQPLDIALYPDVSPRHICVQIMMRPSLLVAAWGGCV